MSGSNSLPPAVINARSDEPLTLTVHSLPAAGNASETSRRKLSGRWKMLLVMLACAAPVIASYLAFYVIRPEGRKNYGELIMPPRALPYVVAQRIDGSAVPLPSLQGQWLLVSVGSGACDETCQKRIYWTRQLREVMGRDKDRIERVWLIDDAAPVDTKLAPQVHAPLADAQALRVSAATLAAWLPVPQAGAKLSDHLYVVDPYGNLMLRWPASMDAAKAKRDVHNLLRASGSWDQAGRVGAMLIPAPLESFNTTNPTNPTNPTSAVGLKP